MSVAKLVKFGRGGDTVHFGHGSTSSGYGSPENPHAAAGIEIPDGTPAVDMRAAVETPEGYAWVFRGPLVDVDLEDGEVDPCPELSGIMAGAIMADSSNPYAGLLLTHQATRTSSPRGSLDSVCIREYLAGWRAHGARIGSYQAGKIVWDN